ncbi:hypothetical protein ACCS96_49035, partial [Rhizobium ruizarguesonis]
MLLRREDAHPSRRFFCGSAFDGSAEPLQSFVYTIPGKIAARFAWNCFSGSNLPVFHLYAVLEQFLTH